MKYNLSNRFECEKCDVYYAKLKRDGKKIELTEKQKRTLSQNALFHVWVAVFAEFIGEVSIEACKTDVKRYLLGARERVSKITGKTEMEDYKTSEMSTKELSDFMDKFKIWAQTEGCYLPYWKEQGFDEMIEQYKNWI